jgi:hypothetical protein
MFRPKGFTYTLRMEKYFSFEILVRNYQITPYHNPGESNKSMRKMSYNFFVIQTEIKTALLRSQGKKMQL